MITHTNKRRGNNNDNDIVLPTKLINMVKRPEGPKDNTSPNTITKSIRTSLHLALAAILCVIPLLLLLGTLIAILKYMYKRKNNESSKNKRQLRALKYIPYWTRMQVTNSLFLPWFSGSFTIEIFNQRDVSSIKTNAFHSETFPHAYEKKEEEGGPSNYGITGRDFQRGNCRNMSI